MQDNNFFKSELPREKAKKYGIKSLQDFELLALILKTSPKGWNILKFSKNILKHYNGLDNLFLMKFEDLILINGIGPAKALEIVALFELMKRIQSSLLDKKKVVINNPSVIHKLLVPNFCAKQTESLVFLILSSNNELIKIYSFDSNSPNFIQLNGRLLANILLKFNTSNLICVHNHPSNNYSPSQADILFTKHLSKLCEILSIQFIDHLIWTNEILFSINLNKIIL